MNLRDKNGQTVLWEAVRVGNFEAVKWLVNHGAELNFTALENGFEISLIERALIAKEAHSLQIIEFLKRKMLIYEEQFEDEETLL